MGEQTPTNPRLVKQRFLGRALWTSLIWNLAAIYWDSVLDQRGYGQALQFLGTDYSNWLRTREQAMGSSLHPLPGAQAPGAPQLFSCFLRTVVGQRAAQIKCPGEEAQWAASTKCPGNQAHMVANIKYPRSQRSSQLPACPPSTGGTTHTAATLVLL